MKQADSTFSVVRWDRRQWNEQPPVHHSNADLFQIEAIVQYHGALEGEGTIRFLLAENGDGKGGFVGLEKVTGHVAGRRGSFVFQHTGTFYNSHIVDTLIVLPGSGDGALQGISGTAMFDFPHRLEIYPFTFYFDV
jgi:hypothetical protein